MSVFPNFYLKFITLQGSFQLTLLYNVTLLSAIWQQQWLTSTWLALQVVTQISQDSISGAWEVFLFKGRALHVIKNQQADSDINMCCTDHTGKNVLEPLDHGGSEPASQCSPFSPVSLQWVLCSFTAVDTWDQGTKGSAIFTGELRTHQEHAQRKVQRDESELPKNGPAQWQSQVLGRNVQKVSNICHLLTRPGPRSDAFTSTQLPRLISST